MIDEIRLFVAATLPVEVKAFLQEQGHVYSHSSIRMVPAQNLHLTLFFIGNSPLSDLPAIKDQLRQIASAHTAFQLKYRCTEPGPNPRSPRLIWSRFEQKPEFEKLSRSLAESLSLAQNAKQKPIPHVTLARYKKDAPPPPAVPLPETETGLHLLMNSFSLWQSQLASPHPVYSVLETYPLTTKP